MEITFAIRNVQLLEDGQAIPDALLIVDRGRIRYAGPQKDAPVYGDLPSVDGQNGYVAPGLIDLQFNGGYGQDFTANPAALLEAAKRLPETGVTAFLPTFITSALEAYPAMLQAVAAAREFQAQNPGSGARILGAHIEGPFLCPARKGAHLEAYFCDPLPAALDWLRPLQAVRLLTLAPERPGALEAIRTLTARGILVSIGHSDAGMEETLAAMRAGARYATHLYNAMGGMQHRDPGLVGTLLTSDEVVCGLIVDGVHVHPRMVRLAYRCLGARRITLVTDAMAAMGMPPGEYAIGGQAVTVDETSARLADGTLAGSILRMDEAVRNMIAFSGCTPAEAVRMASATPAEALGMAAEAGRLQPGRRADLVLLGANLKVQGTFIDGRRVY
jgi:N-acetylglucosamine-6-phosphate deacetylase